MSSDTAPVRARRASGRALTARPVLGNLAPGLVILGLWLLWTVHNGGFDADTWYWGALLSLAVLVVVIIMRAGRPLLMPRALKVALIAFCGYVAWSYLSITWAQAPGVALEGSNRALLYLIVFAIMAVIPWRPRPALAILSLYALGIGAVAVVLLARLASANAVGELFSGGRLAAPAGYFNSNAALFTMASLTGIFLASRRELPGLLRGLLIAAACASLQLAVVAQSRGWLFTLPLVVLCAVLVIPGRIRFALLALLAAGATAINAHNLVAVYHDQTTAALAAGARTAGRPALILTVVTLVLGSVIAWSESLLRPRWRPGRALRAAGSAVLVMVVLAAGVIGASKATHNDPVGFVKRQWNGFSHPATNYSTNSYFETVGSGRYDFWRVSLDAFTAHPIGGLGQDNFQDYYITRRHTNEEPLWTHSLELRLLVHTGAVGFALFAIFLGAAIVAALRTRRRAGPLRRVAAAAALLPVLGWLIHGSVDWFWEIPALTGPALGFLAIAGALSAVPDEASESAATRPRTRILLAIPALALLIAVTLALAIPYLAVREASVAGDIGAGNPTAALRRYQTAADLNPLDADADTSAGLLALSVGEPAVARHRFEQSISRERESWLPWLGLGLAYSALNEPGRAAPALRQAYSINRLQPPVKVALRRVFSHRPLTYAEAVPLFVVHQ